MDACACDAHVCMPLRISVCMRVCAYVLLCAYLSVFITSGTISGHLRKEESCQQSKEGKTQREGEGEGERERDRERERCMNR
jgi:hypothetical protein